MLNKEKLEQAGIHYQLGIQRFAGQENIYEKYLFRFLENTQYEDACEAFKAGDFDKLMKEVHALKGMAGMLGMESLFECMTEIIATIRKEEFEKVPPLFEKFGNYYKPIVAVLKSL